MAIAHVQTKVQFPGGNAKGSTVAVSSLSETFAATPAVGNLIVVFLAMGNGTAPTVTDNQTPANTYTIESNSSTGAGPSSQAIAWAYATTSSGTFTVTASVGNTFVAIALSEFSGVNSSTPVDVKNTSTGSGTTRTGSTLTPTVSGDLFVCCGTDESTSDETYTVPTSYSVRGINPTASTQQALYTASFIESATTAHTDTWTSSVSASYGQGHVTFQAAPSAFVAEDDSWTAPAPGPDTSLISVWG